MKYGYMNYRKHLLVGKNDRPMNIGDPIQSYAVLELFKRLGVPEENIITLDRYDLADYDGEDVIALINGAENYENYAYATRFLPVSNKITPVFVGLHIHRELSDNEIESLRRNQPIGCRDEFTVEFLKSKGLDAFLTGCLTMLFPKRDPEKEYNKIFIVDCSERTLAHIPDDIKNNAEYISQVIRIKSSSIDYRLTLEETKSYHDQALNQLERYRDEAKLVITSRLHVVSPCAAMGIPVILVRDTFDERYRFIDRFLPLRFPKELDNLNWDNIRSEIPEDVKEKLAGLCKSMIDLSMMKKKLNNIYSKEKSSICFASEEEIAARFLPMTGNEQFNYCIWGVCMPNSYLLYEQVQKQYPNARIRYAIDTYATGIYKDNIRIIHPDMIEQLCDKNTWILVVAPAAHEAARELLEDKYNYALIKGAECDIHYYSKEEL